MFLTSNYVLSNELAERGNIAVSNFSMAYNKLTNSDDYESMLKLGKLTFVDKTSCNLPTYIHKLANSNEHQYTDLSNKIPVTHISGEYKVTREELLTAFEAYDGKITDVSGKEFFEVDREFAEYLSDKVVCMLPRKEAMLYKQTGEIDDYIQLTQHKYIAWYSIR